MNLFPQVSIIILNWNGWIDTLECLESLKQIDYPNYSIILIDNGSNDESIRKIEEYLSNNLQFKSFFLEFNDQKEYSLFIGYSKEENDKDNEYNIKFNSYHEKKIFFIKNIQNYGFAKGNNIGIRFALKFLNPKFLLLLNNDTIVKYDFLSKLLNTINLDRKSAIIGPKIFYYDYKGEKDIIWSTGGKIDMWKGKRITPNYQKKPNSIRNCAESVDFVSGAALLVKSEIITKIGLLNEKYFTYCEDIDYCYRVKCAGYNVLCEPNSEIWHKVSASTGCEGNYLSQYFIVRNSIIFMKNNAKIYQWPSYIFFSSLMFISRWIKSDSLKRRYMLKGIVWHFKTKKELF